MGDTKEDVVEKKSTEMNSRCLEDCYKDCWILIMEDPDKCCSERLLTAQFDVKIRIMLRPRLVSCNCSILRKCKNGGILCGWITGGQCLQSVL